LCTTSPKSQETKHLEIQTSLLLNVSASIGTVRPS
jgi:hypothetical protein